MTQTTNGYHLAVTDVVGTTEVDLVNGQDGAPGATGPQGEPGPKGDKGDPGPKGDTYDDTEIKNDISAINANIKANYYNKTETDTKLDAKANTSDVYNKTETDTKLNAKQEKLTAGTGIEITGGNTINNIQGNYSTDEIRIGTWINGKPLYRKVINAQFGTVVQGTETTVEVNLQNVDFILVDEYWLDRRPNSPAINQGPYATDGLYLGYTSFSNSNTTLRFRTKQSWVSNTAIYAIIEYTKTTD